MPCSWICYPVWKLQSSSQVSSVSLGLPQKVYSDNGKTFVGAAKWIKQVMRDEKFQNFLAHQGIQWQFILSRAPWWGGQFERMVGLFKGALHKSIRNGMLS